MLNISATSLDGVLLRIAHRFEDERGFVAETWNHRRLQEPDLSYDFVQGNHSFLSQAGTVRDLQYQATPSAQATLLRTAKGSTRDVSIDIRQMSPTYGHWRAEELSAENRISLLIPRGFRHGSDTLCPDTVVIQKTDNTQTQF